MAKDWVDDENLSREETLRRFEALSPEPTRGPLPGGAVVATAPRTYSGATTVTRDEQVKPTSDLVSNGRQLANA